ncbi:hypothetical protein QE177_05025 [Arsenophonus sp. aPb]|uniref:hypothetical protein n=1 Tax=Arsenophonus sp. aPb TaxID=3041619 RepID=UPI0024693399|nr:hypothetical protein [Arsenophonus sp. aPb]WGL99244.1 hypothetical protein QE177_05025 [Arsenophonus sp. aPb]
MLSSLESASVKNIESSVASNHHLDPVKVEIDKKIENKFVLVFSGFSAMGYEDIEKLQEYITKEIKQHIDEQGIHNLLIVAGATPDGIGCVYDIAKNLGVCSLGIVSQQAPTNSLAKNCQSVIQIKDLDNSWKVLDDSGNSYMVYAASKNGCFLAFGGGSVTLSELEEAEKKGIETKVFPNFLPDPNKLNGKLAQGKTKAEICPIQTKYTKEV